MRCSRFQGALCFGNPRQICKCKSSNFVIWLFQQRGCYCAKLRQGRVCFQQSDKRNYTEAVWCVHI